MLGSWFLRFVRVLVGGRGSPSTEREGEALQVAYRVAARVGSARSASPTRTDLSRVTETSAVSVQWCAVRFGFVATWMTNPGLSVMRTGRLGARSAARCHRRIDVAVQVPDVLVSAK